MSILSWSMLEVWPPSVFRFRTSRVSTPRCSSSEIKPRAVESEQPARFASVPTLGQQAPSSLAESAIASKMRRIRADLTGESQTKPMRAIDMG